MINYVLLVILCSLAAYLIGSCNSSIIVVRMWKKEDIRNFGSKNAGLTNTLRCFGKGPALLTLLSDLLKGSLTILIIRIIVSWCGYENDTMTVGYIAGFMVMLGHIFPVYYGFKGGKGVLVGVSVFLVIDWRVFCILIGVFAIVLILCL